MMHIVQDTLSPTSKTRQFDAVKSKRINKRIEIYSSTINLICLLTAGLSADYAVSYRGSSSDNFLYASIVAFLYHVFFMYHLKGITVEKNSKTLNNCAINFLSLIASLFVLSLTAFAFKSGNHFSRFGAIIFATQSSIAIVVSNLLYHRFIQRRLATGSITTNFAQVIVLQCKDGQNAVNWICPDGTYLTGFHCINSLIHLEPENFRDVVDRIRQAVGLGKCDCVYIISDWSNHDLLELILRQIGPLPAPLYFITNPPNSLMYCKSTIISEDVVSFELQKAPLSWTDRAIKRAMDISIAFTALLLLSPLLVLIALAIYWESGAPILFLQDRKGFGQLPFKIIKFRTMYAHENKTDVVQAQRNDSRVTPLGRLLRKTSIDELPQFFNVIRGDMSIVGPRPHAVAHDEHYDEVISDYAFRHHVKPGITGWAQINGHRGATNTAEHMQKRIEHDIWYINHWSIWLDVRIVIRTALLVFNDENAY